MPRSHKLSEATLRHIADRVSERFGKHAAEALRTGTKIEMTETFEVWFLGRGAIVKSNASIAEIAHRTGYWHHQIRIGGHAAEYARSKPFGAADDEWGIHALARSELPGKIDIGIDQIDADQTLEDTYVRLLLAPAYLTSSLWLTFGDGRELILPVMVPGSFRFILEGKTMGANAFLLALGKEPHARGIPRIHPSAPPGSRALMP